MKRFTERQTLLVILLAIMLVLLSGCTENATDRLSGQVTQPHSKEQKMEPGMDTMNSTVITKEAVMKGNYQEAGLQIKADGYSPDVIIAKRGVPLKINVTSDNDAGCATEIVFPDFNITRTVPAGKTDIIEILPAREGTFNFRCSMDMYRGKIVVTR